MVRQSTLDRGPRDPLAQRCLNGRMDVLGSHRFLSVSQHLDDGLQYPARPARPLPTDHSLLSRPTAGPYSGQFPGQAAQ
jgi:hypothetical protein